MAENQEYIKMSGRMKSVAKDGVLAETSSIFDKNKKQFQSDINTKIQSLFESVGEISINKFDKKSKDIVKGRFINNDTGTIADAVPTMSTSGYIAVTPGVYTYLSSDGYGDDHRRKVPFFSSVGKFKKTLVGELDTSTGIATIAVDEPGYIRFSYDNKYTDTLMFAESDQYPETYIPYGIIINDYDSIKEFLKFLKEKAIIGTFYKSKNLFDKTKIQKNLRFNYGETKPYINAGSCISPKIEIKPNTIYTLHRAYEDFENTIVTMDVNSYPVQLINPKTGQKYVWEATQKGIDFTFKTGENAKYLIFNIDWQSKRGPGKENGWQLEEGDHYSGYAEYEESLRAGYNQIPKDLGGISERVKHIEEINPVPGVYMHGKNLFNIADIQINKRINYGKSPEAYIGSCISGIIKVKPDTVYTLHRTQDGKERTVCSYSKAGVAIMLLNPESNQEMDWTKTQHGKDFTFKTGSSVDYIMFNIDWQPSYELGHGEGWQLEEGDHYSGFEPWRGPFLGISYQNLPTDLEGLNKRVEKIESKNNNFYNRIDVRSSDKIGFFSNSFLNGYTMYGKHAIEKMLMFSDYLPYNYSMSGNDMAEETARLDKDLPFLGVCRPSEVGPIKYGIIMHQDNDGLLFEADHRTYYENAKHLGYSIMSLGAQPILSTEHDWSNNYLVFQRLCQDEGWKFMNWGKVYNEISIGQYKPMWHSGHPATRSNWCQVFGFLPTILSLPRPVQSLKLFRLRSFVDSSNLKNLLYNTNTERAEMFMELHNGQASIKKGQEARFDRWGSNGYAGGNYDTVNYNCEYQDLIKNRETSFGKFLLADVTTPYNVRSVTSLKLIIKGRGVEKIYARQIRGMKETWLPDSNSKFIAFGLADGKDKLSIGDQITINGITREDGTSLNQQYTITGLTDTHIITSELAREHRTSGTDEPQCSVPGVMLRGSYDSPSGSYMENYNKPIGQWTQLDFVPSQEIVIQFTKEQIEKFGAADKFVFLASGTDIKITDIYVDVSGTNDKERHENSTIIPQPSDGQSLLSKTLFGASDKEWINIEQLPIVTAVTNGIYTERLPEAVCRELSVNDWISQKIQVDKIPTKKYKKPVRVQVQILARWFPKYILKDEDYNSTELDLDSFDMAKLEVQLNPSVHPSEATQFPITTMYIGAWWNLYTFEMDWINNDYNYLTLICKDKRVQIASCDFVILEK